MPRGPPLLQADRPARPAPSARRVPGRTAARAAAIVSRRTGSRSAACGRRDEIQEPGERGERPLDRVLRLRRTSGSTRNTSAAASSSTKGSSAATTEVRRRGGRAGTEGVVFGRAARALHREQQDRGQRRAARGPVIRTRPAAGPPGFAPGSRPGAGNGPTVAARASSRPTPITTPARSCARRSSPTRRNRSAASAGPSRPEPASLRTCYACASVVALRPVRMVR